MTARIEVAIADKNPVVRAGLENLIQRVVRGGGFNVAPNLLKPYQWDHDASIGGLLIGFRVATIPEPSTLLLAATGLTALVGVAMVRRRRR